MCGILSIINTKPGSRSEDLVAASNVIRHRGPDDEGFLTWIDGAEPAIWAGADTAESTLSHFGYKQLAGGQDFKVGFGHRRLSILDLSPAGHQPMIYSEPGLAVTFNGEIYNYLEIKAELEAAGHKFTSTTDTEVILHAWQQWGVRSLDRFNGMFAFVLLDYRKKELYAVRDRFGVKPVYYYQSADALYITSEIKQIRTAPGYQFKLNERIARQFLATGAVDHTHNTFDTGVKHLPGGHYLHMDLSAGDGAFTIHNWYTLSPKAWKGSYGDAVIKFRELLTDAVKLRLRSDVKVGSCLSGGLDSSSIVCIASDLLKANGDHAGQETVTACYDVAKYDEWKFAEEVIQKTNAHPHQTFPSFTQLQQEIDEFIWHQDEPTGSTSQFSQWAVFKATHNAGLKVMIDGQGADEQLAGYGGNDLPLYAGLLGKMKLITLLNEARSYKKENGVWPKGFLLGALQIQMGGLSGVLPEKLKINNAPPVDWLSKPEAASIYAEPAKSLQKNLLRQLYTEPLPALLRYEDHNSMAWSVESRTPFLDYRLVEFTMSLPEDFVYKKGVRKTILRSAMKGIIPEAIEHRRDKMGFVTPEEMWLKGEGRDWFNKEIDAACKQFDGTMLDTKKTRAHVSEMMDGKRAFDFMPWRVICFTKWYNSVNSK